MFKKLKDKKGFTLVELIVVLVILAILAALLIPALTGYIDKANGEKIIAETRMIVMAPTPRRRLPIKNRPADSRRVNRLLLLCNGLSAQPDPAEGASGWG